MTDNLSALSEENEAFYRLANRAIRGLFDSARARHPLHFALALMPEMRGLMEPGWNTAFATQEAFHEYMELLAHLEDAGRERMRARVALSFYCHLSEASGFYEVPKNMLRITEGKPYVIWPFHEIVEKHRKTGNLIAPNSNKVLRDLAGHSQNLGFTEMAQIFRDSFDPQIRNAYAHGDYIVSEDGLRLPMRNGGQARRISWDEFTLLFERGLNFFGILRDIVMDTIRGFEPPVVFQAALDDEAETLWEVAYNSQEATYRVTNGHVKIEWGNVRA